MEKYYVYMHKRNSDGAIFYVGKGYGTRAFRRHGRSIHWNNVVAKHGLIVEICQENMQEDNAFLLEMWLISKFRHEGISLVNLTDGGEGMSNPSEETRNKLSASKLGRKMSDDQKRAVSERMKGSLNHFFGKTFSDDHKERLAKAREGRKLSRQHAAKIGKSNTKKQEINLYNEELGSIFMGCRSAAKIIELTKAEMSMLCSGKRGTAKGWVLLDG